MLNVHVLVQCSKLEFKIKILFFIDHECPSPSPVLNGDIILAGQTPGSCYTVNCHHGYRLLGNRYKTCQTNGEWSGEVPFQCVIE